MAPVRTGAASYTARQGSNLGPPNASGARIPCEALPVLGVSVGFC